MITSYNFVLTLAHVLELQCVLEAFVARNDSANDEEIQLAHRYLVLIREYIISVTPARG